MNKKALLNRIDQAFSGVYTSLFPERPALSVFLFHAIFRDNTEVRKKLLYSPEKITVDLFRLFLEYFLSNQYRFLSPGELYTKGWQPDQKYALLTFDDGYFNNTLVLDLLKEYKVPAIFFVPTGFIDGEKHWPDVLTAERSKRGVDELRIAQEVKTLEPKRVAQIKDYLVKEFGSGIFLPAGDIDRPFTPAELRSFAAHPSVYFGNHTHTHNVLTNLTEEEVRQEISHSQEKLQALTGSRPDIISYPCGCYNDSILRVVKESGFKAGITTVQAKNFRHELEDERKRLLLKRFNPVAENGMLYLRKFRSDFQFKTMLKQWSKGMK